LGIIAAFMKELFSYTKPGLSTPSSHPLVLKIGMNYAAFAVADPTGSTLFSLHYYSFSRTVVDDLKEFTSATRSITSSTDIRLIYDIPMSVVVPFHDAISNDVVRALDGIYGSEGELTSISNIEGWQLKNCFVVDEEIREAVQHLYPMADIIHQYDIFIRCLGPGLEEGELIVDFRPDEFVVVARQQSNLLFARHFEYQTPADVLYYLLKIAGEFRLSPATLSLKISGLIDKDSALYKELYQYFLHIILREADWGSVENYPAHYFTSFNDILKCVS
jgi:hypothetical protein